MIHISHLQICLLNEFSKKRKTFKQKILKITLIEIQKVHSLTIKEDTTNKNMRNVKFDELCIKVGQPYVYRHQSNCDHYICITEIRKYEHQFDDPIKANYPKLCYQESIKRRICEMCEDIRAKLIVMNNELKQDKAIFMCEKCYEDLHFDQYGNSVFENVTTTQYFHE